MLISWASGFGNNQLGITEDVLGDNGTIQRAQSAALPSAKDEFADGNGDDWQRQGAFRTRTC